MNERANPRSRAPAESGLWRPAVLFAGALLGYACSSEPGNDRVAEARSPVQRKRLMLAITDRAISELMIASTAEIESVRSGFERQLQLLPTPVLLNVVHDELENYDVERQAKFRADALAIGEKAAEMLRRLLMVYEQRLWTVATSAGHKEKASDFEYLTGYMELDEKVLANRGQLLRSANVDGVLEQSIFRSYDRVELNRLVREPIADVGFFCFYSSTPESLKRLPHFPVGHPSGLSALDEMIVYAFVLQRAETSGAIPVRFIQARRIRAERAGIVVTESPWILDPSTTAPAGELPAQPGFSADTYHATAPGVVAVDPDGSETSQVRNHVLIVEHRTGLARGESQEMLGVLAWQVKLGVDAKNRVRVIEKVATRWVPEDTVLKGLLSPAQPGADSPSGVEPAEAGSGS